MISSEARSEIAQVDHVPEAHAAMTKTPPGDRRRKAIGRALDQLVTRLPSCSAQMPGGAEAPYYSTSRIAVTTALTLTF